MSEALHLRLAAPADLDAIMAIKLRLRMRQDPGESAQSSRGGFLLGASRAQYARLIAGGHTWVLGDDQAVVGVAPGLYDPQQRAARPTLCCSGFRPFGSRRERLCAAQLSMSAWPSSASGDSR